MMPETKAMGKKKSPQSPAWQPSAAKGRFPSAPSREGFSRLSMRSLTGRMLVLMHHDFGRGE